MHSLTVMRGVCDGAEVRLASGAVVTVSAAAAGAVVLSDLIGG